MVGIEIKRYAFNAQTIGIEAKTMDYLVEKAHQTTIAHRAEFYQFIWIEQGELTVSVDFEWLVLRAGEALLISPGQVCLFSLDNLPQKAYAVFFVPEFLGEATSGMQLLRQVSGISPLKSRIVSLDGLPISGLINQLISELSRPNDRYQEVIARSCLRILLAEIARLVGSPQSTPSSKLAERFVNEVEKHHHHLVQCQSLSVASVNARETTSRGSTSVSWPESESLYRSQTYS